MDRAADFFVSYSSSDRAWAEWIAWQLEQAGYLVVIQAWDFEPGDNHVARMRDGLEQADPTLSWANVPPVLARLWSRSSCDMHPPASIRCLTARFVPHSPAGGIRLPRPKRPDDPARRPGMGSWAAVQSKIQMSGGQATATPLVRAARGTEGQLV